MKQRQETRNPQWSVRQLRPITTANARPFPIPSLEVVPLLPTENLISPGTPCFSPIVCNWRPCSLRCCCLVWLLVLVGIILICVIHSSTPFWTLPPSNNSITEAWKRTPNYYPRWTFELFTAAALLFAYNALTICVPPKRKQNIDTLQYQVPKTYPFIPSVLPYCNHE